MKHLINKALCALFTLASFGVHAQTVKTYHWPTAPGEALLSTKYRVILEYNGHTDTSEVIMSNAKDLEIPDYAQQFRGGRTMNWTEFSSDFKSPVTITVEKLFGTGASVVELFPSAYELSGTRSDDYKKVTFTLTEPKYVSVNFKSIDNFHTSDGVVKHMMMIFADPLETDVPSKTGTGVHVYSKNSTFAELQAATTIYFPQGYHNLSAQCPDISNLGSALKNSKKIYFEGGAYVQGRITKVGVSYVKIYGRGVLSGRDFKWSQRLAYNGGVMGVNSFDPMESAIGLGDNNSGYNTIDGIIVCDGNAHGINLGHHATHLNTKTWTWHPNNDGMRPWGSGNKIDHCFIRPCDDAVYNKGLTITNTVFWPGFNGSIVCLGWNGPYNTENTTMTNNYVIYPEWRNIGNNNGIVMSQCDYDMTGTNVVIKNLTVDGNICALTNLHTNSDRENKNDYNPPTDWYPATRLGYVDGVSFDNVKVSGGQYSYSGSGYTQTATAIKGLLRGANLTNGTTYYIKNVAFKNVQIGNDCLTSALAGKYFTIDAATTSNITFSGCADAIEKHTGETEFTIYPNPASGRVTISNANAKTELSVFDQAGHTILQTRGNSFDTTNFPTGLYFIKIDGQSVVKLNCIK